MNNTTPTKYMVQVICMTFNHAPYIEDAMNGFTMQQTTSPYVCTIVDDNSTDGEQEVLRNYLQQHFLLDEDAVARQEEIDDYVLTFARHKTNQNCYFAVYFLKYNHYSIKKAKAPYFKEFSDNTKYTALCEGDDYWTDPNKLQLQVDFLESHPEYTMCFHDVDIKAEKGREWYDVFGKLEDRDYTGIENMVTWSVPTCSMVMHRKIYETCPVNPKFTMGDNVLILHCSRNGRIRCIPKKMGVYRLTPTSWIGGQTSKVQRYKYISHYHGLIEEFEECRCQQMYDILENQYFQLLTILKCEGDKAEFERVKQEYLNFPGTPHWSQFRGYYIKNRLRSTVKSLLGKRLVRILRRIKNS
jgi:glycosyltransferase involved in cell wall biosynthesis